MRIFDPTKVTRLSLQDAASVAGLQPTTEVMLAEVPKEKECEQSGGTPGMSGMDM